MSNHGERYCDNRSSEEYKEHDVRMPHGSRSGTFKHCRRSKNGSQRGQSNSVRRHVEQGNVYVWTNDDSRRRYKHGCRGNRSGFPSLHNDGMRRQLLGSPSGWFRVTLPYGNKYEKEFLLQTLVEHVTPIPFIPFSWSVKATTVTFYVDNYVLANKLHNLDRQILCPDHYKLLIRVHCGSPNVTVNADMKEKLKLAMGKRYNAATKALDLANFHADPELQDLFCALFKPLVLKAVINIISENTPELEALNLDDNRIHVLSYLSKIDKKLPNLKILHLGNNKIRDITMLDSLVGLPIREFVLTGNPVCNTFREQSSYISEIRKRFPKVIKLDGIDLPPPIVFDIGEKGSLPTAQETFLCNDQGAAIVRQFLEQYFLIYDSNMRQPLLQAYHENAMFSMTSCYPYGQQPNNSSSLDWYKTDNRNLLRVRDHQRQHLLLRQGPNAIVSFLSDMPATKHDFRSFTMDLNLVMPQMLLVTVTGIFKELQSDHNSDPIRFFYRTLVIVPVGSGFRIANEQLHVTNATKQQAELAFVYNPEPLTTPDTAAVSCSAPVTAPSAPDEHTKLQMIQAMSLQSDMNLEWSRKCLEDLNWDFNQAVSAFTELHKQGIIPTAAFVK